MQRVLHILATRRAAIVVIAAVILTLAGFAVWAARTTYQSVNNVQRLTTANDAFGGGQVGQPAAAALGLMQIAWVLPAEPDAVYAALETAMTQLPIRRARETAKSIARCQGG